MVLPFLAGALSGAVFVIFTSAIVLAVAVRRFGKEVDRENVALSEAGVSFHRGSIIK